MIRATIYHRVLHLRPKHKSFLSSSSSSFSPCQETHKLEWLGSFQALVLIINNFDINYKPVFLIKKWSSLLVEIMLIVVISLCRIGLESDLGMVHNM